MATTANQAHIDGILSQWREIIGEDYQGYRNHVVRMASCCLMLHPCTPEEQQKIEIAACFHDIGLWTENTMDYLPPSVPPAVAYLEEQKLNHWANEIIRMILDHHKLTPVKSSDSPLVELFRKGDLVDFSLGTVTFGLPRASICQLKAGLPNAGFHRMLLKRSLRWVVKHPLRPLPMMKW